MSPLQADESEGRSWLHHYGPGTGPGTERDVSVPSLRAPVALAPNSPPSRRKVPRKSDLPVVVQAPARDGAASEQRGKRYACNRMVVRQIPRA